MNKCLTPWYPETFGSDAPLQYIRFGVGGEYLEFMVWKTSVPYSTHRWYDINHQTHNTDKEALEASDKRLLQQGYVFLTAEQIDKFRVIS